MRLPASAIAFLAAPLLLGAAPPPPSAATLAEEAMKDRSIPAIGIVLIRHGRIASEAVAGVRARDNPVPVRKSDLWHIGSDEKAMTATLIARLVERGTLSWDTPLFRLIPELAQSMRADYRNVDIKELLSHRAGLQDLIDSDYYESLYHDTRPLHAQRLDYVRMALSWPPRSRPGPTRNTATAERSSQPWPRKTHLGLVMSNLCGVRCSTRSACIQ